ncbi:hypothetical protein M0R04_12005 [Candidatus Dojkabacteria bacterium]|jgi:hypothetical protein|nr:hypothetical protein [Candidatus Dojkabacteria bacterium]
MDKETRINNRWFRIICIWTILVGIVCFFSYLRNICQNNEPLLAEISSYQKELEELKTLREQVDNYVLEHKREAKHFGKRKVIKDIRE